MSEQWSTVDEVVVDPERARVYAEGWQSWSPTRPHLVTEDGARPDHSRQHAMRFRPGRSLPGRGVQGEGLLVLDPGTGDPVRAYAATDARRSLPSYRARGEGGTVVVSATEDVTPVTAADLVAALTGFGDTFAAGAGVGTLRPAPTAWCTWYQYFEQVTGADVEAELTSMAALDLPVDVVQVDDGWSLGLGEGLAASAHFGDLAPVVARIRDAGRRAGIWLAPFLVSTDTTLAREHPDWLVGYAGHNWGQDLRGLDLTHAGVRALLRAHVERLRDLGLDYYKLDFLYAGALEADRPGGTTGLEAYRSGLVLLREAAGPDAFFVACGAPVLPSVGLVDAMRVSPDTFHEGGEDGSRGLRGRMSLAARAWQQGRLWVNDPDCLVARPSYLLREEWTRTVERFGGLRASSDRLADLDDWGLATTRRVLGSPPGPVPFAADVVAEGLDVALADGRVIPAASAGGLG